MELVGGTPKTGGSPQRQKEHCKRCNEAGTSDQVVYSYDAKDCNSILTVRRSQIHCSNAIHAMEIELETLLSSEEKPRGKQSSQED